MSVVRFRLWAPKQARAASREHPRPTDAELPQEQSDEDHKQAWPASWEASRPKDAKLPQAKPRTKSSPCGFSGGPSTEWSQGEAREKPVRITPFRVAKWMVGQSSQRFKSLICQAAEHYVHFSVIIENNIKYCRDKKTFEKQNTLWYTISVT